MLNQPMTKEEAMKRRGYDIKRCAYEVSGDWYYSQCSFKNGHGPDGLYCKRHAKMVLRYKTYGADQEEIK